MELAEVAAAVQLPRRLGFPMGPQTAQPARQSRSGRLAAWPPQLALVYQQLLGAGPARRLSDLLARSRQSLSSGAMSSAAAAGALCTDLEPQRYLVALFAVGAEVHSRTVEDRSEHLRSARAEVSNSPSGTVLC